MRMFVGIAMGVITGCSWAGPKVAVCLDLGPTAQPIIVAEKLASRIFADIGVETEWPEQLHHGDVCPANADVVITLSAHTSPEDHPGAWAYALPYEGKHVVVFWDRVQQKFPPARAPFLLAYVLVHEITHTLQAVNTHSESGVMKVIWDEDDLFRIWSGKPLGFTERDVKLIYRGWQARSAALGIAAINPGK